MKTITDYLSWPMTDDFEAVLTNLSWEKKFELSVAFGQMALEEKQGKESWDRIQVLDSIALGVSGAIASPPPGPIAFGASRAIEPPEKTNEPPT
jgi:hypothetical protein